MALCILVYLFFFLSYFCGGGGGGSLQVCGCVYVCFCRCIKEIKDECDAMRWN